MGDVQRRRFCFGQRGKKKRIPCSVKRLNHGVNLTGALIRPTWRRSLEVLSRLKRAAPRFQSRSSFPSQVRETLLSPALDQTHLWILEPLNAGAQHAGERVASPRRARSVCSGKRKKKISGMLSRIFPERKAWFLFADDVESE